MRIARVNVPSLGQFRPDTRLLLIASAFLSMGFIGLQNLLKVLYILRLDFGLEYIGLYTAMGSLTYMAMSVPSGAIGLRFGIKPSLLIGAILTTAGMVLLPFTEILPRWAFNAWPIVTQMLIESGWAMLSINMVPALMAVTTDKTRDDAYALYSMLRRGGTFIGTIVGGLLPMFFAYLIGQSLDDPAPYRWALLLGSVTGFVGIVLLMRITDLDSESEAEETVQHGPFPLYFVALVLLYVFLFHGGTATVAAFGNAYMDTALSLSAATIGFITGGGQLISAIAPIMMPVLAAKRGNAWTLMMAAFGTAIFIAPIAFIPTWFAAGIGRMGMLAINGVWLPALQAFQMNVVERHWRSLAYGAISMGIGLSFGIVSFAGGFIAASMGYSALFSMGMAMSAASGAVMWSMRKVPALSRLTEKPQAQALQVLAPEVSTPSPAKVD